MERCIYFTLLILVVIRASCPPGRYGKDCLFICGKCDESSSCDPDTGQCPSGCLDGWQNTYCNISYPLLRDPPVLRNRSGNSITICWTRWTFATGIGQGKPAFYLVQIKTTYETEWRTIRSVNADDWSEKDDGFQTTVQGIRSEFDYHIRVVVVDHSGQKQEGGVPIAQISKTRNVRSDETTPRDVNDESDDANEDYERATWVKYLLPFGVVAGSAFMIALCIVLVVECRRRQKLNTEETGNGSIELSENCINNSRLGLENAAFVTLRRDAKQGIGQIPDDKTKSNQGGRWKEAVPGLSRATAPESWYTEWGHDSRIYENDFKT